MSGTEILYRLLKYSGLNTKSLSEKIGLDRPQALYDIQKGKTKAISQLMARKIVSEFPELNIEWILTGEGEMLKTESKTIDAAKAYYIQSHMVNEYISKLGTSENQVKVATLLIPHLIQKDEYFFAYDIVDDRMSRGVDPALNINDIVIAELTSSREPPFFEALISSPVIVVVLSDKYGQLVRKISSLKNGEITLSPTHPIYKHDKNEHAKINVNDIKQLGIVKKILVSDPIFKMD